jgi:hypothetical protein
VVFICGHCERPTNSEPFRVITEEAGIILLNMIVCAPCAEQAKNLGLKAAKIRLPKSARNKINQQHLSVSRTKIAKKPAAGITE